MEKPYIEIWWIFQPAMFEYWRVFGWFVFFGHVWDMLDIQLENEARLLIFRFSSFSEASCFCEKKSQHFKQLRMQCIQDLWEVEVGQLNTKFSRKLIPETARNSSGSVGTWVFWEGPWIWRCWRWGFSWRIKLVELWWLPRNLLSCLVVSEQKKLTLCEIKHRSWKFPRTGWRFE